MSSRGPRRTVRGLRALALGAPALFVVWWLVTRSDPAPSAYEDALDRALAPVIAQRDVQAKLRAASSGQARQLAREFSERSIPYLGPRDLELWQSIRVRVAKSSPTACARLWRGGSSDFFGPAVVALHDDALDLYTEMLGRALALRLERKPPPEPAPGALGRGLAAIAALLPEQERASFEADLKRSDLPDGRACQLFLTISTKTEQLEPGQRSDFLRALAKDLQAP